MGDAAITILPALCAVIGLAWFAGLMLRKGWIKWPTAPSPTAPLAIVQTLAIDSRRRLHLVRCEDRQALLLTGGNQDALLGWIDRPKGPA
jgi:flagellar protein FliO/FliZ